MFRNADPLIIAVIVLGVQIGSILSEFLYEGLKKLIAKQIEGINKKADEFVDKLIKLKDKEK